MPFKLSRASNAVSVHLHGDYRSESWLVSDAAVLSTMSATHQQHGVCATAVAAMRMCC